MRRRVTCTTWMVQKQGLSIHGRKNGRGAVEARTPGMIRVPGEVELHPAHDRIHTLVPTPALITWIGTVILRHVLLVQTESIKVLRRVEEERVGPFTLWRLLFVVIGECRGYGVEPGTQCRINHYCRKLARWVSE